MVELPIQVAYPSKDPVMPVPSPHRKVNDPIDVNADYPTPKSWYSSSETSYHRVEYPGRQGFG